MTTIETPYGLTHVDDSLGIPVFGSASAFEDETPRSQVNHGPETVSPPEVKSISALYEKWGALLPVTIESVSPES